MAAGRAWPSPRRRNGRLTRRAPRGRRRPERGPRGGAGRVAPPAALPAAGGARGRRGQRGGGPPPVAAGQRVPERPRREGEHLRGVVEAGGTPSAVARHHRVSPGGEQV